MGHVMSIGGTTDYEDLNMKMRGIGKKYGQGCILQAFTGFYGDIEASVSVSYTHLDVYKRQS